MALRLKFLVIVAVLLAAPTTQAQFIPYQEFLFTGQPSPVHFDSLGLRQSHGVYESEVTGGKPPVKEGLMRSRASLTARRFPLYENRMWFDIEYLSTDEFLVGRAQAVANAESLAKYIGWAKNAAPALQVGLYSTIPVTDLYMTTHFSQRRAANDAIQVLADSLDYICPSIYLYYSEQTKPYASYAVPLVAEARRLAKGKKVIPFIAPGYHPSGDHPHQYATYEVWKNVLRVIKDSAKADGFMMFAGLNALGDQYSDWARADTSGWWRATKEFLASLRSDSGLPSTPSLLMPDHGIPVDPSSFTVSWRKADGAVAYHIQIAPDSRFRAPMVDDSTISDTTLQVTGLSPHATYYIRIRAMSVFSWWGNFSSPVHFTTSIPPPPPPSLVSPKGGSVIGTTSIIVRWQTVPGAIFYNLQLAENGNFQNSLVNDSSLTDTVRMVDSLKGGTRYTIRVRARGITFWSDFANSVQFETSPVLLSIRPTGEEPAVSYLAQNFPNPFNPATTIRFSLSEASLVRIDVYNMLGELVRPLLNSYVGRGVYDIRFDASGLPSGLYVYRIRTDQFVDSKRMLLLK